MNYWQECVAEALDDAGVAATKEQIATITSWVQGAHENYGMAHGHDAIPNPLLEENARLGKALKDEQNKVTCKECNGKGSIVTSCGPTRSASSGCWKCKGEGRHLP